MKEIDLQILVEIKENSASCGITPHRWDDSGNRIDDMPDSEFEQLLKSLEGKSRFDIQLTCNGKKRRLRSPVFEAEDRKPTLDLALMAMRHAISKNIEYLSSIDTVQIDL
jgi:hypothetical protein